MSDHHRFTKNRPRQPLLGDDSERAAHFIGWPVSTASLSAVPRAAAMELHAKIEIFLSYANEDAELAAPLVVCLEAEGWFVWQDREVRTQDDVKQLERASHIVVVWSKASMGSRRVRTTAEYGLRRATLVSVLLDDFDACELPQAFSAVHASRLSREGHPDRDHDFWPVIEAIRARMDRPNRPSGVVESSRAAPTSEAGLRQLALDVVDMLARVSNDPDQARDTARRAGFPLEHLPVFRTATTFWGEVVEQAINGRAALDALVGELARQFPYNSKLLDLAEIVRTHRSVAHAWLALVRLGSKSQLRTQQEHVARILGVPPREVLLDIEFSLIPPGITPCGSQNRNAFYLANEPLSRGDPRLISLCSRCDRQARVTPEVVASFLATANPLMPAERTLCVPTVDQWTFVALLCRSLGDDDGMVLDVRHMLGQRWQYCRSPAGRASMVLCGGDVVGVAHGELPPQTPVVSEFFARNDWSLRPAVAFAFTNASRSE